MSLVRKGVFIVAAKRTPYGTYGGSFKDKTCTDLAEIASKAALTSANINPELINSVIFGNVVQSNSDTPYLARHVGNRCNVPISSPALTVNRLCGSSFQSIINGVHEILLDESDIVLTGGSENMSEAPYVVRNIRFGTRLGVDYKFEDVLWAALFDKHINTPMGITAENLAEKYKISRQDCDEFAFSSQKRWKIANEQNMFDSELTPVTLKSKKKEIVIKVDEHPRETTMESLTKLPPVFKKDGTVTAGNASGVCDGAGAVVIASEDAVNKHNLKPLSRIIGYSVVGCDPNIMGIGPVPAIRNLLKVTKQDINGIDLVEVNEAFAAQYLAVEKELGLNRETTNSCGGAIALGHPVGASGARIMGHLAHKLQKTNKKMAIGAACIGGGQGIAIMIERM